MNSYAFHFELSDSTLGTTLDVSYDPPTDILTINGVRYSGAALRWLADEASVGHSFKLRSNDKGIVTLETI